ncbi:MAG: ferrous iron transport protein A [Sedimentisphaerales bacterium]|nr:ferrous iron transport protein A [Sedimentisphaerales bacterium]
MKSKEEISLRKVSSGTLVMLLKIDAGQGLKVRLAAMGLLPGVQFTVINNGHPGPFVIDLKGNRMVLGKGMADKMLVKPISKND